MAERRTATSPSLPEKVIVIHETLRQAKVDHAFGGALALAYYAEPRATIDIDLNVFLPAERWREAIDELGPLGVAVGDLDQRALIRDGQCRLWWDRNPVDLFFSYDPIHEEMKRKIRRLPFADEQLPFLSPEHLTVCKAMFNRPKDWLDIEQIAIVSGSDLDFAAIEQWLVRMAGPDDFRVRRIAELRER